MPSIRPIRVRRLLTAIPLTLALVVLVAGPSPAALAGGGESPCSVKKASNTPSLLYTNVQSAVDAVTPGSTLEVRGVCLGPVIIGKNLTLVGKATTLDPQPGIYGQESYRVLLVQRERP